MKKIILIGNGFDLAHDMKTKHSDVFDFFKEEIIYHKYNAKPLQSYSEYIMMEDFGISNSEIIMKWYRNDKVDKYLELEYDYNFREMVLKRAGLSEENSVSFYANLFNAPSKENWESIETTYYETLSNDAISSIASINNVNDELEHYKGVLKHYLKLQEDEIDAKNPPKQSNMIDLFKVKSSDLINKKNEVYSSIALISFNYTSKILNHKIKEYNTFNTVKIDSPIHIHNTLEDQEIVFGYGNDTHDNYRRLLNHANKNECLKNFKTFNYLNNNKLHQIYHELSLDNTIDLQIIGLSCSHTDKTLLKELFTHRSVRYIQVCYHESREEYLKIAVNIARIIDDDEIFRKKVIPFNESLKIS